MFKASATAAAPVMRLAAPTRMVAAKAGGKGGKGEKKDEPDSVYRSTVFLPETSFNMRANAKVREPEIQQFWADQRVYEKAAERDAAPYTLHDGPPYANGDLHIGHALNKILKDMINKYQVLQGKKVRFVPGWDCHGLPIELKVLQSMSQEEREKLDTPALRKRAAEFARETVDNQRASFRRYGVWADWEAPYLTLQPEYEAAQIDVFAKMVEAGHIYRGKKPVHWSPSSRTALAEAELEYPEGHTSPSIYVSMPVSKYSDAFPADVREAAEAEGGLSFAVWTTTPWTMPANLAIAINDRLSYAVCRPSAKDPEDADAQAVARDLGLVVVAEDLIPTLEGKWGMSLEKVAAMKGAALDGCTYRHPLYDRESPVVVGGEYITTEAGTGLVHTAPGHGQEDYMTGMKHGLEVLSPVDEEGRFTAEAGERFVGLEVQEEGNWEVIKALKEAGALVKKEKYAHKYPYDWRTKKPTIFRTTEQWFASVEGFREAALGETAKVKFVPAAGANRLASMVEGRSDWCISRQRKWGVPIPVFYDKETGEPLMTKATMEHVRDIFAERGSDAWFELPIEDLLPAEHKAEAGRLRKGEDTMDVWFDSGTSWAGVLGARGMDTPADLYLEGSDQHRGWFQSSLLTAVAATGKAPYKSVLTHGFVLDEKGMKMSKSIGNVVDPRQVIDGGKNQKTDPPYGADLLRLWVASVDYTSDVMIGPGILKQVFDVYRKVRTTARFLLGTLSDFDPAKDAVPLADLPAVDQYILGEHVRFIDRAGESYESYQFFRFYQALQAWCSVDLSNFYLDTAKDRLYLAGRDSFERRACQTTLWHLTRGLLCAVAPIMPHMAEDAWISMGAARGAGAEDSIFLSGWQDVSELRSVIADSSSWEALRALRDVVNKALEAARRDKLVGASLDARVEVFVEGDGAALLKEVAGRDAVGTLGKLLIVSEAKIVDAVPAGMDFVESAEVEGLGKVTVGVAKADGAKCERCWVYDTKVGESATHPTLCPRCNEVVADMPLPQAETAGAV